MSQKIESVLDAYSHYDKGLKIGWANSINMVPTKLATMASDRKRKIAGIQVAKQQRNRELF